MILCNYCGGEAVNLGDGRFVCHPCQHGWMSTGPAEDPVILANDDSGLAR